MPNSNALIATPDNNALITISVANAQLQTPTHKRGYKNNTPEPNAQFQRHTTKFVTATALQ